MQIPRKGSDRLVQIQLLGGIRVATDGGDPLDVGPAKCQAVLAALALSAGEAVAVSRLVDVVWGAQPPATADKTLQGYVARLRKALGREAIVRVGAAYRLAVQSDAVDVVRFRRHLQAGDMAAALAEWTGPPLAGLAVPGLRAAVDGLVEDWLAAVETDLERRVASDPPATIATLTQLTSEHPFREGLWALLMTALYRAGRQGDALAAFQRARWHLVEELGIEPGPKLRALHESMLTQDEALQAGPAESHAAPVQVMRRPTGTVTFGFAEVADATRLWGEHRRKMALAMARLDTVVRAVTERYGGTMAVWGGESVGVAFHRADEAAMWASELQVAVEREPWPGGVDVRLQVALHSGETEEHDGRYFGVAVHSAARLAAVGHAGQILVAGTTAALLGREDLRNLGTHRLDDVAGSHDIWQLDDGDHPPLRTASARPGNLPRALGRLVGRQADLEAIATAQEAAPVVTLVGPGGIGKTALALASARRAGADRPWRVWLVELAEITQPEDVPAAAAETLGVTGGGGRSLTESVAAALHARPTLLVLDNCEHVTDGAAALARAVVEGGADSRVLATSRERLGIPGEQVIRVTPLDVAGASVELFAERARAASATFDLNATRPVVEAICRRLDGLPLAIELAAARTTSLTPTQLLDRLDDRLRLLGGTNRTGAERHQTLRATVQWSHDLLSAPQQQLFARLAVFAGPFDLAAAEAVATADADTLATDQHLGDLVERSMVNVEPGPFGRRFRLLETLRQFALEQLVARGGLEAASARHADWCRDQIAHIGRLLTGPGEIEGVARLAELWPNLRAAVDWACVNAHADFGDALVRPVAAEVELRRQTEIGDWAARILDSTPPQDEDRSVFWLFWAGRRHAQAGDRDAYHALVRRHGHAEHPVVRINGAYLAEVGQDSHTTAPAAMSWLRDHGEHLAADLVEVSGRAASLMTLQRFAELEELAADMADRHRHGPPTLRYFALGMQGYAAQYQGKHDDAARYFTEAEAMQLPAGTYRVIQTATARMAFEQGERSQAYQILRDNIDHLLDADYTDVTRLVAVEFITMMAHTNRLTEAAQVLSYLDTTGDYGALAREHLIADAVHRIDTALEPAAGHSPGLDAHEALILMRDTLDELTSSSR